MKVNTPTTVPRTISLVLDEVLVADIDAIRRRMPGDIPSRSEAVRELLRFGCSEVTTDSPEITALLNTAADCA